MNIIKQISIKVFYNKEHNIVDNSNKPTFFNFIKVFALILFSSSIMSAQNIYVSKTGNDSNPGTQNQPYLTISKAASVATAGQTVIIKEGTYEEMLRPANSGAPGNPIVFRAAQGEKVVITAMQSLSGWTSDSNGIYKTTIPFTHLDQENFVMHNDKALDLARWPNNIDGLPFTLNSKRNTGGSGPNVINGAYLTSNEIPNIDWTGGALFFYGDKPGSGWLAWKEFITSSSSGRVNFNFNKDHNWIRTFHAPGDKGDFYLEGVKGALDYQNEWWFNKNTNQLFVKLPGDAVPVDGTIKMRKRRKTIDLNNRSFIEIRDLAVFGGSVEMKNNSNDNVLYRVSSFYGNHTQGVFSNFRSDKASLIVKGNRNRVEKCEVAFNAATGIDFAGRNSELKNCYIHDFNYLGSYDAPLVARGGRDNKIIRNTIFNGGRDAIAYNGQRNEIAYNDVSYSNLIADDCALFYTVGSQPDTEIHHNWFHDAYSRGSKSKAAGVYLDNDGANMKVHHNVIWNTEWTAVQMNWDAANNDIFNNTMWNNSKVMGAWHKPGTSFSNIRVWNNLSDDNNWEPQANKQNNLAMLSGNPFMNSASGDFRINAGSQPVDYGRVINGTTDGYSGSAPDAGAYEVGDNWVAGVDWDPSNGPTGQGCYGLPGEDCNDPNPNPQTQSAYGGNNAVIPGIIQAENYDLGGQGVAYNDSNTTNQGNSYRTDGVDIRTTQDTGGGHQVGWTSNGEWLEYTTNITQTGTYSIDLRVASGAPSPGAVNLSLDGTNLGSFNVVNTGSYDTFNDITINDVALTEGNNKILRLEMIGSGFDINYIKVNLTSSDGSNAALPEGAFYIKRAASSHYLQANGGVADVTSVTSNASNQTQWKITNLGNNIYDIRSEAYQLARLEVPFGVVGAGNKIATTTWTGPEDHIKWVAQSVGSNFILKPLHDTTRALDFHIADPTTVWTQNLDTDSANQIIELVPVPPTNNDPVTATLNPVHDSYLQNGTNYNLNIVRIENNRRVGYLMFDTSSLEGTDVSQAQLKFTVTGDSGNGNVNIHLGNGENWTESNLNSSNKPSTGQIVGAVSGTYNINALKTVDLTSLNGFTLGSKLVLIVEATSGNDFAFGSKENNGVAKPELVLTTVSRTASIGNPLKIYPNPATTSIQVDSKADFTTISIFDGRGIELIKTEINKDDNTIDISKLNPGIYLVLTGEGERNRFIKR